ncbi:MAG: prephenate dehydrogenase/arogenate dehydrogenase family protein [Candidatus Omnitrophota bacterium]|nr:prephenate dehydrogenase/arogenate dehydrogenase family protein [Candidatus Omnitrophota bacterium]
MKVFDKVAIIGVGLIGGSFGLALKKKALAKEIIGIGHRQKSIDRALRVRAIDQGYLGLDQIKGADLVVLSAPVKEIINILPKLKNIISEDCLIIDAGSTKSEIIKIAEKHKLRFIGCHPLAGMEKKGPENARADLFKNSLCLLIPPKKYNSQDLSRVKKLWEALEARTVILNSARHDRILAFTSHLPHAVVFSLIDCLKSDYLKFGAGGLKDTTRIGLSDPLLWKDIFLTNRKELLLALHTFEKSLQRLKSLIKNNNDGALRAYLEKSRDKRNGL